MAFKAQIPVVQMTQKGLHGMDCYLVRGVGPRAIKVVVRPFHGIRQDMPDDEIAMKAARYAARKGWKKVIVEPDMLDGEYAEIFNMAQHLSYLRGAIAGGKYLCYVGSGNRY